MALEAYTLDKFKSAILAYEQIGDAELRANLREFIKEIIPVAEEAGVSMAIHPDDPPWPLLGLPRVVSKKEDLEQILKVVNSPANCLTLCTGSLGAGFHNDPVELAASFADRINFIHLRNVVPGEDGDFIEEYHLSSKVDMFAVVKTLLIEQKRREGSSRKDNRMPMRPDHGHLLNIKKIKQGSIPVILCSAE